MIRRSILIALSVLIPAAGALIVCRALGVSVGELAAATAIGLLAAELGMVPLLLSRGGDQSDVAQSALVGSAIHLLFCLAAAVVLMVAKLGLTISLLFWLMGFYWITLGVLVTVYVRAIRAAPVTTIGSK